MVILKEQFERVSQLDGMANCLFELAGEQTEGVYEEIKRKMMSWENWKPCTENYKECEITR